MVERYGDDSTQHPPFDTAAWVTATSEPKKGRVFGFGSNMNTTPVVASSSQGSQSFSASINSQRLIDPANSWDGVRQLVKDIVRDFLHETIFDVVRNELCGFFWDRKTLSAGARQVWTFHVICFMSLDFKLVYACFHHIWTWFHHYESFFTAL